MWGAMIRGVRTNRFEPAQSSVRDGTFSWDLMLNGQGGADDLRDEISLVLEL